MVLMVLQYWQFCATPMQRIRIGLGNGLGWANM